jgi:hypothetical protein
MNRAFRIIKFIFLVIGLLLLLSIPVSGLVSTAVNWKGVCYGFTDGQWECPWWEYAGDEMFWAMFIFIPFLFIATLVFLGMSLAQFIVSLAQKRRQKI